MCGPCRGIELLLIFFFYFFFSFYGMKIPLVFLFYFASHSFWNCFWNCMLVISLGSFNFPVKFLTPINSNGVGNKCILFRFLVL